MTPIPPRVQFCLDTGNIFRLAAAIGRWTTDELNALVRDVGEFFDAETLRIDAEHKARLETIGDGTGLSTSGARLLAKSAAHKRQQTLVETLSEICSVAYALGATPPPDED